MADRSEELSIGGLRFGVTFREVGAAPGATLRVVAPVNGDWKEVLRFDDFVDAPHFHGGCCCGSFRRNFNGCRSPRATSNTAWPPLAG